MPSPTETTFQIEDWVPLPPSGAGRPCKYPLRDLGVGQSFFVQTSNPASLKAAASHMGKRIGRTFTTRKVEGGYRVWRMS